DLIESFGMERKTGVLTLSNANNKCGEIYFRDGAVINASLGNLKAEKAVYQMLPWKHGHFTMTFKELNVPDEISVSNLGLLLHGFKRMEERERLFKMLPSPEATFVTTETFRTILKKREVTTDVAKFIALIDGKRDILQIIDESTYDDIKTLERLVKLYQQGFIKPSKASVTSHEQMGDLTSTIVEPQMVKQFRPDQNRKADFPTPPPPKRQPPPLSPPETVSWPSHAFRRPEEAPLSSSPPSAKDKSTFVPPEQQDFPTSLEKLVRGAEPPSGFINEGTKPAELFDPLSQSTEAEDFSWPLEAKPESKSSPSETPVLERQAPPRQEEQEPPMPEAPDIVTDEEPRISEAHPLDLNRLMQRPTDSPLIEPQQATPLIPSTQPSEADAASPTATSIEAKPFATPPPDRLPDMTPASPVVPVAPKEEPALTAPKEAITPPAVSPAELTAKSALEDSMTSQLLRLVRKRTVQRPKLVIIGRDALHVSPMLRHLLGAESSLRRLESATFQYLEIGERKLVGRPFEVIGISMEQQFTRLLEAAGDEVVGYIVIVEAYRKEDLGYLSYLLNVLKNVYRQPLGIAVIKSTQQKNLSVDTLRDLLNTAPTDFLQECVTTDKASIIEFLNGFTGAANLRP
ncbi:MAG: DUF4388 domain-containing protein, partial [candidate division KSB1 bacterium]|nr:DUF4388 domain-containing protein [candidate division KSB1 bacterium]